VRDTGHADRYSSLTVNYVDHHNPDLFLFNEDGSEIQKIDLTRLKTTANIHKLLKTLGIREKCLDLNETCEGWANAGQCDANPDYMQLHCRKSCQLCSNDGAGAADGELPCVNTASERDCEYWSTMGECTSNPDYMREACARRCGVCKVAEQELPMNDELFDDDDDDDDDGLAKDEL
jgi:hypothetical protein